jgi:hypothetical protein
VPNRINNCTESSGRIYEEGIIKEGMGTQDRRQNEMLEAVKIIRTCGEGVIWEMVA